MKRISYKAMLGDFEGPVREGGLLSILASGNAAAAAPLAGGGKGANEGDTLRGEGGCSNVSADVVGA